MEKQKTKIDPEKYYSIRRTAKLIPWIHSEPTLQKIIHDDIQNNNNQLFKAVVLKRNKQRRYYLKGVNIINVIKMSESGNLIQNGSLLTNKKNDRRK
jgi:hypothetical protein